MLYAWSVRLANNPLFSSKVVTSRKSKKLWTKGPEWNNAAYGDKKNLTISHTQHRTPPIFTPFQLKRKNKDVRKRRRLTPGARNNKKGKKHEES